MKRSILLSCAALSTALAVSAVQVPEVSNVEMSQVASTRTVTITYTLDAPAVVTVDIQTNSEDGVWASIGGQNFWNMSGDVWGLVPDAGDHAITWQPEVSWPDHRIPDGGARAVVTAWALDDPPDYMVVDLSATVSTNFYPTMECLPGGLLENDAYRLTSLVMRKIPARDVTFTMGSTVELGRYPNDETAFSVKMSENYYIGVFPVTQSQFFLIAGYNGSGFSYPASKGKRPVEKVSWNEIRCAKNSTTYAGGSWPDKPYKDSVIDKLRVKTGIDFDLPSECQWEYACRSGYGDGYWNNGAAHTNSTEDLNLPGRYIRNGGYYHNPDGSYTKPSDGDSVTESNATAIVGSYAPNRWGIYDMHGNIAEWCLDWFEADITKFGGAPNIDRASPLKTLSGADGSKRVNRGGNWNATPRTCRSAFRGSYEPNVRMSTFSFRVVCPATLVK